MSKLHIFTDALLPLKNLQYFQRYFETVNEIAMSGVVPKIISLMKLSFWNKFVVTIVFFFVPLSPSWRVYLLDYFSISNIGVEFNLLMLFIFLNAYLFIDQLYLNGSTNDYIIIPYQILIKQNWSRYFLRKRCKNKNIVQSIRKVTINLANCFVGVVLPSRMLFFHN